MYNAELYQESNILQKRDARQCLEDYSNKLKWKNDGAIVIDIGCGDGGVTTSILKTFIPDNFKELVGCDISEHMVQYANAHHATDCIRFTKLDIASVLPQQFCEKFDHAFSSYALHWIRNQEIVFSNIYDLLTRGGHCLLVFVGYIRVYDMYRELTRIPRWSYGVDAVERFVPLYYDCQDPEKPIHEMMSRIGFTDVRVKCEEKEFIYYGEEIFKKAMLAISPFEVPLDRREDFYKDLMKVAACLKLAEYGDNDLDNQFTVKLNYKNIIVYGQK